MRKVEIEINNGLTWIHLFAREIMRGCQGSCRGAAAAQMAGDTIKTFEVVAVLIQRHTVISMSFHISIKFPLNFNIFKTPKRLLTFNVK